MTLTTDDKQRLTDILATNQKNSRGGANPPTCAPVTDETTVLLRRGLWAHNAPYHAYADGEPACGATAHGGYRATDHDAVTADADRRPCSDCFPDGSGGRR